MEFWASFVLGQFSWHWSFYMSNNHSVRQCFWLRWLCYVESKNLPRNYLLCLAGSDVKPYWACNLTRIWKVCYMMSKFVVQVSRWVLCRLKPDRVLLVVLRRWMSLVSRSCSSLSPSHRSLLHSGARDSSKCTQLSISFSVDIVTAPGFVGGGLGSLENALLVIHGLGRN